MNGGMTVGERISKTTCTICQSPALEEIDSALVAGTPYRKIATRHGVSTAALVRHKRNHLSPSLQALHTKREEKRTVTLLNRVESLVSKLEVLAEEASTSGKSGQLLQAARELRESYRLLGKLTGELDERPQVVNVLVSPEWQQVRAVLLAALAPYPDARVAVAGRLLELGVAGGGSGPVELPVVDGSATGGVG